LKTGIFYHDLFGKHLEGYTHVESPQRYFAIMERLRGCSFSGDLEFVEAERAEIGWIKAVHDPGYVDGILAMEIDSPVVLDWGDTVATRDSQEAALFSAGAGVQAARSVLEGKLSNAFCLGRPPGHHAERDRAMGFCIFNNIAIAAEWLLSAGGLERVAIIDWDIHHGNGTERIFFEDDRVMYISLHQFPHYPGTGNYTTVGLGKGTGFTLNIPVGSGTGDSAYYNYFEDKIIPALDDFAPGFILISAGFDAHADDPLSGGMLSTDAFARMTGYLMDTAARHCSGRLVSLLEGGYDLDALADCAEKHVGAMLDI
jgi:acetoin utilization deacetylase AcuC-like enzyme